jgi:hypothetical protein
MRTNKKYGHRRVKYSQIGQKKANLAVCPASLRIPCRKAYRFNSCRPHQKTEDSVETGSFSFDLFSKNLRESTAMKFKPFRIDNLGV